MKQTYLLFQPFTDEEQLRKESAGFIVDDEEEDGEEGSESPRKEAAENDASSDDDDVLDDDDYDLIQENIGVNVRQKKKKRRLIVDSEEEGESDEDERVEKGRMKIAQEIFEADEDDESVAGSALPAKRSAAHLQEETGEQESDIDEEEDDDDMSHFIVNELGEPLQKKKVRPIHKDAALQEAQDIFGVDFDFDEIEGFGEDEEGDEEAEEDEAEEEEAEEEEDAYSDDSEEGTARRARRKAKKARSKQAGASMYEVFDPSELERGFHTERDQDIRLMDQPERFQLRAIPVRQCEHAETEEETEWIFRQGFLKMPISQQELPGDSASSAQAQARRSPHVRTKIREALHFMRNHSLEVPFIAFYRKEYVEPELKIEDLWKIFKMDETWCQLRSSKENIVRLIEKMRDHLEEKRADIDVQFTQLRNKVEAGVLAREERARRAEANERIMERRRLREARHQAALEDGVKEEKEDDDDEEPQDLEAGIIGLLSESELASAQKQLTVVETERQAMLRDQRPLTSDDLVRARMADTLEEVRDVYANFLLYYGPEVERMKRKAKRKKASSAEMDEEDEDEEDEDGTNFKRATRQSAYTRGLQSGLGPLTRMFGLTPEQLAENLRDQYQRHEVEQHHEMPLEAAAHFLCTQIPTPEYAMRAARQMVAAQIAAEPSIRQIVRKTVREQAKISVKCTKKGRKEIDENHPVWPYRYLKNKPITELTGPMFLQLDMAAKDGFLTYELHMDPKVSNSSTLAATSYFDEVKQYYHRDEFSSLVQTWNAQRFQVSLDPSLNFLFAFAFKVLSDYYYSLTYFSGFGTQPS